MYEFCFGNNSSYLKCEKCKIRYTSAGTTTHNIPKVVIKDSILTIEFIGRVIAKDFATYFGSIQELIMKNEEYKKIEIDISKTDYMNQFCISKIILSLVYRDDIEVTWMLPTSSRNNKMLRFFYNLGILDFLFSYKSFKIYVANRCEKDYKVIYDFNDCYDKAIFPFKVFEPSRNVGYTSIVESYVYEVLLSIQDYMNKQNKGNVFMKIHNRLYLYLYELIDNIFEHAYDDKIIFAIAATNSYLPPYKLAYNSQGRKFANRIKRIEKEVPKSVYGDIQDRYFGGLNLYIDDIGKSIETTYKSLSTQKYHEVYLSGTEERKHNKTKVNGLKLVAEQIAYNNDILWAHDNRNWINCSFTEYSNITIPDQSEDILLDKVQYTHLPVKGTTYDIRINLAKNSEEKRKAYRTYGEEFHINFDEIGALFSLKDNEVTNEDTVIIDLLNLKNKTKSFKDELAQKFSYLFFRPREIRKNKQKTEMETRIFDKLPASCRFKELIIYDLNQTTLFQMKAVIESNEIAVKLSHCSVNRVLLLSEDCWVFVFEFKNGQYKLTKVNSQYYCMNYKTKLNLIFTEIIKNDRQLLDMYLSECKDTVVIAGEILWDSVNINHYLDVENMLNRRNIFELVLKGLLRISGLLSNNQKVVFLEGFMENLFSEYLNEYKENAIQKIYFGSVLLTKNTEKNLTQVDDPKFYLFKHIDSIAKADEKYFFLYRYPNLKSKKTNVKYRRIRNSNRIEQYLEGREEFKFYFTEYYKSIIKKIEYKLGLFQTGMVDLVINKELYIAFKKFLIEIIYIKLKNYNRIKIIFDQELLSVLASHEMAEFSKKKLFSEIEEKTLGQFSKHTKKKLIFEEDEEDVNLSIYIKSEISFFDLLQFKKFNIDSLCLTVFNSIRFDERFDKIVDIGYLPFIPIYRAKGNSLIDNVNIEKFKIFTKGLVPTYRKVIEQYTDSEIFKFDVNQTTEIKRCFDELAKTYNNSEEIDLFYDVIFASITLKEKDCYNNSIYNLLYDSFISLLQIQHSISLTSKVDNSKIVKTILERTLLVNEEIPDTIITFLLMLIIHFMDINTALMIEVLQKKEISQVLRNSNSYFLRIIFAKICKETSRLLFQRELNEIFVSNDIVFYYNILYQNLFNKHGNIHDSVLNKFTKRIEEKNGDIDDQNSQEIKAVLSECISLLKLTKPYSKSYDALDQIDIHVDLYTSNISKYTNELSKLIENISFIALKRFIIIEKEKYTEDIKAFILTILDIVKSKKEELNDIKYNLRDYIICKSLINVSKERNIILYNDAYVLEELAYLFDNAIANSIGEKFSIENNEDKHSNVWIICTVTNENLVIRILNYYNESFTDVINKINSKRRIGKTHLEKFKIHVSYYDKPKEVIDKNFKVFETKIEIPYFN